MNQTTGKTVIHKVINIVPVASKARLRFRNHYLCPNDGTKWHDAWYHVCNDRCPVCDDETEPYFSEDISA